MYSLISSFLSIIHRAAVLMASFQFFKPAKHFPTPVPLHKLKCPSSPVTHHYSCFLSSQSKCQPLRTFSTLILSADFSALLHHYCPSLGHTYSFHYYTCTCFFSCLLSISQILPKTPWEKSRAKSVSCTTVHSVPGKYLTHNRHTVNTSWTNEPAKY